MLKAVFDSIMDRRSDQLIEQIGPWLPDDGPVLDVGSGTGHLAAKIEQESGIEVVPTDVTDMHVVGRAPVQMKDGRLPFDANSFSGALLVFMLHYPDNPAEMLAQAQRVSRGPIIVVQSLYTTWFGHAWLRAREFVWSFIAFHLSLAIGYVPRGASFTMNARRVFSQSAFELLVHSAGLRIVDRREKSVVASGALVVAAWLLAPND